MNKKYIPEIVAGVGLVLAFALFMLYNRTSSVPDDAVVIEPMPPTSIEEPGIGDGTDARRIGEPGAPTPPGGKLKADVFSGTLESVNTGCFADGECSIEVDGKHVTALMGWSRDTVGTVQGVEGFGDLESHIGEMVEVYAQDLSDGTYTLYGSEGFYIKLIDGKGAVVPEPGTPVVADGCVIGGCSSQLCVEGPLGDVVSTCEWREEYGCYRSATCERQTNGKCGWTETPELRACLDETTVSAQ